MGREIVGSFRAILHETRRPVREWSQVVTLVQWAPNSAYERLGTTPFQIMIRRVLLTGMKVLACKNSQGWHLDELGMTSEQLRAFVDGWMCSREEL